jgi:hypothetical protein
LDIILNNAFRREAHIKAAWDQQFAVISIVAANSPEGAKARENNISLRIAEFLQDRATP